MTLQWRNVLLARDLLNGVKLGSRYNRTSFEPYNPHYLARQFCLAQEIPLPYNSYAKFDERASLYVNELARLKAKQQREDQ